MFGGFCQIVWRSQVTLVREAAAKISGSFILPSSVTIFSLIPHPVSKTGISTYSSYDNGLLIRPAAIAGVLAIPQIVNDECVITQLYRLTQSHVLSLQLCSVLTKQRLRFLANA